MSTTVLSNPSPTDDAKLEAAIRRLYDSNSINQPRLIAELRTYFLPYIFSLDRTWWKATSVWTINDCSSDHCVGQQKKLSEPCSFFEFSPNPVSPGYCGHCFDAAKQAFICGDANSWRASVGYTVEEILFEVIDLILEIPPWHTLDRNSWRGVKTIQQWVAESDESSHISSIPTESCPKKVLIKISKTHPERRIDQTFNSIETKKRKPDSDPTISFQNKHKSRNRFQK